MEQMDKKQKIVKVATAMKKKIKEMAARQNHLPQQGPVNFHRLARAIAFLQLLMAIVALLAIICVALFSTVFSVAALDHPEQISNQFKSMTKHEQQVVVGLVWIAILALIVETVFQFKSSFSLLHATEYGTTVTKALECTRYWRNVTVIFTILDATAMCAVDKTKFATGTFLIIRLLYIWAVGEFTKRLEMRKMALASAVFVEISVRR